MTEKWDRRFLGLARYVAGWSKDPGTKVGAVIARMDRTVASIGFNGFPQFISDDPMALLDRERKLERVVHAEMNALLFLREPLRGTEATRPHTLYTWPILPCHRCAVHVIQAGIARCVAPPCGVERWKESVELSRALFDEAGIDVVEMDDEENAGISDLDGANGGWSGGGTRLRRRASPAGAIRPAVCDND